MSGGTVHVDADSNISDQGFAIRITDASMAPEFTVGDIVIIDPAAQVRPGDCVLAEVAGQAGAVFREYRQRDGGAELSAQNPVFSSYRIGGSAGGAVIGPMVEHRRRSRLI